MGNLSASQLQGFCAAWGGWTLAGMDSSILCTGASPAMCELLPKSRIAATAANTGCYALFMVGRGGATLVADQQRVQGGAYNARRLLYENSVGRSAKLRRGARYGWRAMFLVEASPALSIAFIRWCVTEPERWQAGEKLSLRHRSCVCFDALRWFKSYLFFLGVGGASFCVHTIWLPEQYPPECRASAFAFTTAFGRFIAAGATFIVRAGVSYFGMLGKPVALTAIAFVFGLLLAARPRDERQALLDLVCMDLTDLFDLSFQKKRKEGFHD